MFQDKWRLDQLMQVHYYVNRYRRELPDESQKQSNQYGITPHYKKITVQTKLRISSGTENAADGRVGERGKYGV